MLDNLERTFLYDHGYLPEHLPDYVESVSGEEPFLHEAHLCFFRNKHLTFIGYPIGKNPVDTWDAYESACKRFQPKTVAVLAPEIRLKDCVEMGGERDSYYRLELPIAGVRSEVSYMVRRAARDLTVALSEFSRDHRKLVKGFLASRKLTRGQKRIFKSIPDYLKRSHTASLLEARKGNDLVAFDVMDLGSAEYGFYLFNFRSPSINVPGASDLLIHEMAHMAHSAGKRWLNLGLGINPGVRRFKEKWGAAPFMAYSWALVRRGRMDLENLVRKL